MPMNEQLFNTSDKVHPRILPFRINLELNTAYKYMAAVKIKPLSSKYIVIVKLNPSSS